MRLCAVRLLQMLAIERDIERDKIISMRLVLITGERWTGPTCRGFDQARKSIQQQAREPAIYQDVHFLAFPMV